MMSRAEELFQKFVRDGESALKQAILDRDSENLWLDFKNFSKGWKKSQNPQDDITLLKKGISGFGNSEGGVIVWGVDCSKDGIAGDVARALQPAENAALHRAALTGAISKATLPPHSGVELEVITNASGKGYVVALIPAGDNAPFQMVPEGKYFIRAGSSFEPTPHGVLAGLFGRRPQPKIQLLLDPFELSRSSQMHPRDGRTGRTIVYHCLMTLTNKGKGIAKDAYVTARVISSPGKKCGIQFMPVSDQSLWRVVKYPSLTKGDSTLTAVASIENRIPPSGFQQVVRVSFEFNDPIEGELLIECQAGSDGGPPFLGSIRRSAKALEQAMARVMNYEFPEFPRSDIEAFGQPLASFD